MVPVCAKQTTTTMLGSCEWLPALIFTFMHLADAFIQSDFSAFRLYIYCQYVCSLRIEPTTFALLMQCSTTEPQEHCEYDMRILGFLGGCRKNQNDFGLTFGLLLFSYFCIHEVMNYKCWYIYLICVAWIRKKMLYIYIIYKCRKLYMMSHDVSKLLHASPQHPYTLREVTSV